MYLVHMSSSNLYARVRCAYAASLIHLLVSIFIACAVAAIVFGLWFPQHYRELTGGRELFWLIVSVDVVCGPLLTLVVYNPNKARVKLVWDLAIITTIQLCALGFGLHTLAFTRPIALAFETDRFHVVTISDISKDDLSNAPSWLGAWSLTGPRMVGTRRPRNNEEFFQSIEKSASGIESGQRPDWWQDYQLSASDILERARPVTDLVIKHPEYRGLIDKAVISTGQPENTLRWLPLVSRRAMDWTMLVDAYTARPVGYVHLDGF